MPLDDGLSRKDFLAYLSSDDLTISKPFVEMVLVTAVRVVHRLASTEPCQCLRILAPLL